MATPLLHLLETLHSEFELSSQAYRKYLDEGMTFRHARRLRELNTRIRKLLSDNLSLLPQELQQDAVAITEHFDTWMKRWDDHKDRISPGDDDEFVFANEHRFPRQSANRLEQARLRLKEEGS